LGIADAIFHNIKDEHRKKEVVRRRERELLFIRKKREPKSILPKCSSRTRIEIRRSLGKTCKTEEKLP